MFYQHRSFICPWFTTTPTIPSPTGQVSDDGLQWLIARGLAEDPLPASKEPAPSWPPEGPKALPGEWDVVPMEGLKG